MLFTFLFYGLKLTKFPLFLFSVASQRLKDEIAEVTSEIENLGLTEER